VALVYYAQSLKVQEMPKSPNPKINLDQPVVYQIRIKGHLDPKWAAWFEDLNITLEEDGETLLTGPVTDQAALHGLLRKVRDLGMPLISVTVIENDQASALDING
jgi:hypothetical protein